MAEKKDLMSRLKAFEIKELESNEAVQSILQNAKDRNMVFDLFGTPIKVVTAFPREVRYIYERKSKRDSNEPLSLKDIEGDAYTIISKLCKEEPFNTPQFWEYFDTETGMLWGVFNSIYEGIAKNEEKIGDFRKK